MENVCGTLKERTPEVPHIPWALKKGFSPFNTELATSKSAHYHGSATLSLNMAHYKVVEHQLPMNAGVHSVWHTYSTDSTFQVRIQASLTLGIRMRKRLAQK